MSSDDTILVRRDLFVRAALDVLSKADGPVARKEVFRLVEPQIQLTESELAPTSDSNPDPRWQTHLAWRSVDMRAAGWLEKTPEGWKITNLGREVLKASSEDATGLDAQAIAAYRATRDKERKTGHYVRPLERALEVLSPGHWTTYSDLAEFAATNAQTVGNFTRNTDAEGAHRVLRTGGTSAANFQWSDGRTGTQREALEIEGVRFDKSGAADPSQRMRSVDFRALLIDTDDEVSSRGRSAWLVRGSAVDGANLTELWQAEGFVSLRASKLRTLNRDLDKSDLQSIIDEDYSGTSYSAKLTKLNEFHTFINLMRIGDLVVTTSSDRFHLGTIDGPPEQIVSELGLSNLRRSVAWSDVHYAISGLPVELRQRTSARQDVVDLTPEIGLLQQMVTDSGSTRPPVVREAVLKDANAELATRLHVSLAWLKECIDLLRDRPQLIFYGPPGTGKTYLATKLAAYLAGDNVRLVQFHPSYAYEDFFEGYRPNADGGFSLRPGPLRKVVDDARENPASPYFLIIDEINRGNLSKIFGELYFLLEYRDESVDLLYATDDESGFTLPKNVFILGTMNTADRSIALVDTAMRRRFAFLPLHPDETPTREILPSWLSASGFSQESAELLNQLNQSIEDPDFKIGPSYFMRSAVHEPGGLERVWRTSIIPLLEEHHFGEDVDVPGRYGIRTMQARAKRERDESDAPDHSS